MSTFAWKSEWDALLGTISDPEMMRRVGAPYVNVVYNRRVKLGIPSFTSSRSVQIRFWEKVDKGRDGKGYGPLGCWLWRGARGANGYGKVTVSRVSRSAHAVAWELVNGPFPEGRIGCHTCNRGSDGCVRPEHVYAGTHQDNAHDRLAADFAVRRAIARERSGKGPARFFLAVPTPDGGWGLVDADHVIRGAPAEGEAAA